MICNERFKKIATRFGFKITRVDGRFDILSVKYHGKHLMTIPKRMYSFSRARHKDIFGRIHPDFFDREHALRNWSLIVKRTPYMENLHEEERQIKA